MWKLAGISSLGRVNLFIGVYLLSLIRSRKSNWLHVGSIPIAPTRDIKLVLEDPRGSSWRILYFIFIFLENIIMNELSLTNIQCSH